MKRSEIIEVINKLLDDPKIFYDGEAILNKIQENGMLPPGFVWDDEC